MEKTITYEAYHHQNDRQENIRCPRCGRTLPREAFYTRPTQQKPYISCCKTCHRERMSQYYRQARGLSQNESTEYYVQRDGRVYHRKGKLLQRIITEQQIETIKTMYPRHWNNEICDKACISSYLLYKIAKRLGLCKDHEYLLAQRQYNIRKAQINLTPRTTSEQTDIENNKKRQERQCRKCPKTRNAQNAPTVTRR